MRSSRGPYVQFGQPLVRQVIRPCRQDSKIVVMAKYNQGVICN